MDILPNLFTLLMLILLQAVLGFDNLLYISLESKRAPEDKQRMVRIWGIGLAVVLRICLLFILMKMMSSFQASWFSIDSHALHVDMNFTAAITLFGGAFIVYTAVKEVVHMLTLEESHAEKKQKASVAKTVSLIVMMNVIFSFDSILSAMAITKVAWIMVTAIIISGLLMVLLADTVSRFLQKNRLYEVLGLFILFIVGILLLSEGGHMAHLSFWGHPVEQMSKGTFYFVIATLVLVDIVQGRYQKKLLKQREKKHGALA
ncbi:tellurium resistance protein TerC [Verrucomicrobiaceae bacterium N1E253]|uniref:Tellurium resistance protein TerC n=1 Tax=Oceaniferula marina TaxID=2748318 RepID=A0A851GR65_9BACT|nr:TerC family protein [Oceaniferula marina]NWK57290.1 tellurium resistance protein TerC [Oceaniferula marina]